MHLNSLNIPTPNIIPIFVHTEKYGVTSGLAAAPLYTCRVACLWLCVCVCVCVCVQMENTAVGIAHQLEELFSRRFSSGGIHWDVIVVCHEN